MSTAERIACLRAQAVAASEARIAYDLVFVLHAASAGWILEKICKVVEAQSGLHCGWVYSEQNQEITEDLPHARAYFFAHYALAHHALLKRPEIHAADRYVWFTHPDPGKSIALDDLVTTLGSCTHVFMPNSEHHRLLLLLGLPAERMTVVLGGADPQLFVPHTRGKGAVGFVGAYYPRKNPGAMLQLVESMPAQRFILLAPDPGEIVNQGLSWRSFDGFERLRAAANLTYVEADYASFPRWYREMDVFVSLSSLEGGPIPLLEAMMSNVFPVVTRTGFAEDVIEHGRNGTIVPVGMPTAQLAGCIAEALRRPEIDIRATSLAYSWAQFGRTIVAVLEPKLRPGASLSLAADRPVQRLLHGGWRLPEADGTWSCATEATLAVPLDDAQPGPCRLRLACWSMLGAVDPDATVTVLHDSIVVASRTVPAEPFTVDAILWLTDADLERPLALTLAVSRLATPADVGVVDDKRTLGIKLGSVGVAPLAAFAAPLAGRPADGGLEPGMLAAGWHRAERAGVWSSAETAILRIPLAGDGEGPRPMLLALRGRVLGTSLLGPHRTRFSVTVEGRSWDHEERFLDDTIRRIELPFDLRGPALAEVRIVCARLARPLDLDPESHDRRSLGFFLSAVEVRSVDHVALGGTAEPVRLSA